jgi:hypothetical protein
VAVEQAGRAGAVVGHHLAAGRERPDERGRMPGRRRRPDARLPAGLPRYLVRPLDQLERRTVGLDAGEFVVFGPGRLTRLPNMPILSLDGAPPASPDGDRIEGVVMAVKNGQNDLAITITTPSIRSSVGR